MGTAQIVILNNYSSDELVMRAFLGGVVLLCVALLVTRYLQGSRQHRTLLLIVVLSIIAITSGALLGSAWVHMTEPTDMSEVKNVRD